MTDESPGVGSVMKSAAQSAAKPSSTAVGELGLLESFLNTSVGRIPREDLPDPETAARWLRERELLASDERLSEGDFRRIITAREALRNLLIHRDDPLALADVNRVAREAVLRVDFGADVARLEPAIGGAEAVLGRILAAAYDVMRAGEWPRFKACANLGCRRAFYDRSKNRSATWCSMTRCGNRLNARAYRRRHAND